MKHLLPKDKHPSARSRTAFCIGVLIVACLSGSRMWAAEPASVNEYPRVINAIPEPGAEVNDWLKRVVLHADNPETALPILLQIMQADLAVMVSTNGVTFRPLWKQARDVIRALPEQTLAAYRLRVEGVVDGGPESSPSSTNIAVLEKVFRTGLAGAGTSPIGLQVAGLYLDQGRYGEARRILQELLDDIPATDTVARSAVLARLVAASARIGDTVQAQWAWGELQKADDTKRWAPLAAEVRAAVAKAAPEVNGWTMAYGGPSRSGAPAIPCRPLAPHESWVVLWNQNLAPGLIYNNDLEQVLAPTPMPGAKSRASIVDEMTRENKRPEDGIVFAASNRAWMLRPDESVAIDLDAGKVLETLAHAPSPVNPKAAAANTGNRGLVVRNLGNDSNLRSFVAASLLGNRVYRIVDGSKTALRPISIRPRLGPGPGPGPADATRQQPRGNALAAFDAATGKELWRLGRECPTVARGAGKPWSVDAIRFIGSPVLCAGRLLVPMDDDNGLSVVALDPESGAALWRTYVAPGSLAPIPRLIPLTVDGTCAYLCNENGAVCALDANDGTVLWSALYASFAAATAATQDLDVDKNPVADADKDPAPDAKTERRSGWEENLMLVEGNAVVALPGNVSELIAFHRRSGEPLWRRPKPEGVDYAVGRRGAALVVAGAKVVVCVDLTNGQERWRQTIAGSSGRGVLRGPEVLIPCGWKIQRLRLEDGTDLGSMPAETPDNLPLGNLYVHGDNLLVTGLERLYALTGADAVFAELRDQLARQPAAEAHAKRGQMLTGLGRQVEALADLREAWKLQRGKEGEAAARARLTEALYRAVEQDPAAADRYRAEARQIAGTDQEKAEAIWQTTQGLERKGDIKAALAAYAEQLTGPDILIRCGPEWQASSRLLAARRIRALLAKDEAALRTLLEKPAEQTLAQLGPKADRAALVETATLFAGTAAGRKAAFQAAQAAADSGDFGFAATMLTRVLVLSPASYREEIAGELVRIYERMKWPRGAARLCEEWPRLGGGAPLPDVLVKAAAGAAPVAGPVLPPPPWRLKWKKGPDLNGSLIGPSGFLYYQPGSSRDNNSTMKSGCLSLETGLPRWEKAGVRGFSLPANVFRDCFLSLAGMYVRPLGRTQAREWDAGHLLTSSLDVWSGTVVAQDPLCLAFKNAVKKGRPIWSTVSTPTVSEAGVEINARETVLMAADLLTGKRMWMMALTEPGNTLEFVSTMLAPDGAPAVFPQAGHVLVLKSIRGAASTTLSVVLLEPLTGEELSRRAVDASHERVFWSGHAFGLWRVAIENKRLMVKTLATDATVWTSSPDLAMVKHQALTTGTVLVETEAGELLVLDGADGKILCRSGQARFDRARNAGDSPFTNAICTGSFVVAERKFGEVNEIVALDLVARAPIFNGVIGKDDKPVAFFTSTPTNLCLVTRLCTSREELLKVVNEKGENVNGWGLPLPADRRFPDWCFVSPYFTRDLIVLECTGGDILAYEHDPSGDKK